VECKRWEAQKGLPPARVADGTRTRDSQDHNLVLYQLNYSHHRCGRADPTSSVIDLNRMGRLGPNLFSAAASPAVRAPRLQPRCRW
jgi:hypothetical protein